MIRTQNNVKFVSKYTLANTENTTSRPLQLTIVVDDFGRGTHQQQQQQQHAQEEPEHAPPAGVGRPTCHGASDETVISRKLTQDQPDTFTRTEQLVSTIIGSCQGNTNTSFNPQEGFTNEPAWTVSSCLRQIAASVGLNDRPDLVPF